MASCSFAATASFEGEKRIRVGDDSLLARTAVVIATGTGPVLPPIPGLAEAGPWGNREATTAKEPPESLVILGGGVVGVELAQAWSSLGTKVVVLEGSPRVIVREEPFASAEVEAALRAAGVDVRTHSRAVSVARDGDVTVTMEDGTTATGSEFLVAVGRQSRTEGLGLETIGLEPGKPVEVGSNLRSPRHDWLYAIGDANGRALLTHMGKYQGRLAADAILGKDVRVVSDGPLSPRVIFTDPQVAAVGHTLSSAESAGMVVTAVDVETSSSAGASFVGRGTAGTSRLIVDDTRRVIVGATFTGFEVAEWLHAATIAVVAEVPLERLVHAVPCFPTRSEIWIKLLEAYGL